MPQTALSLMKRWASRQTLSPVVLQVGRHHEGTGGCQRRRLPAGCRAQVGNEIAWARLDGLRHPLAGPILDVAVGPGDHQPGLALRPQLRIGQHVDGLRAVQAQRLPAVVAAELQRKVHVRYLRYHWLPGWVEHVENQGGGKGIVTVTLFDNGDAALYETLVRMAQSFSLRYPLIDGSGNFGSLDGDSAAAMRYTECRLARLSDELLSEIDNDTVHFRPNYDGTKTEPVVLPARIPNLLINGTTGIAVGMATNIPPHNLGEVCTALLKLLDNPDLSSVQLCRWVKGPDFPTGGQVLNSSEELKEIYRTGSGTIRLRAHSVAYCRDAQPGSCCAPPRTLARADADPVRLPTLAVAGCPLDRPERPDPAGTPAAVVDTISRYLA